MMVEVELSNLPISALDPIASCGVSPPCSTMQMV